MNRWVRWRLRSRRVLRSCLPIKGGCTFRENRLSPWLWKTQLTFKMIWILPTGLGIIRYVEYGFHCFGASQASPLNKRIDLEMPWGFHGPDRPGGCGRSPWFSTSRQREPLAHHHLHSHEACHGQGWARRREEWRSMRFSEIESLLELNCFASWLLIQILCLGNFYSLRLPRCVDLQSRGDASLGFWERLNAQVQLLIHVCQDDLENAVNLQDENYAPVHGKQRAWIS
jgi:hypothetical protein